MDDRKHPLAHWLQPAGALRVRWFATAALVLLAVSALSVVAAAAAMPEGYSWRFHSISESAAQGQHLGWIARLAFVSFGAAALSLAVALRQRWARITYWMSAAFAFFMFGAAAFSHAPWWPGAPSDPFEDLLHSVCASSMGFAFCVGVAARLAQRGPGGLVGKTLDVLALVAATALPLLLASASGIGGLAQRVMFVVAYLWFGHEALVVLASHRPSSRSC